MAVRHSLFTSSTHLIWKSCSTKRENPAQRVVLVYSCASDQNISIKATALQIRSTSTQKLKVFEDESTGIVCYRDENGEITCEGYDEGPRYCQQFHRFSSNSRDEEIIELLQRCWFHVTD